MSQEIYNDGSHICVAFRDLVTGEANQANQYLILDNDHAALIDPGGEPSYSRLFMAVGEYVNLQRLDHIIVSHQDPDVVASLSKWVVATECKVVVPALWERMIPHFTRPGKLAGRILPIPEAGLNIPVGQCRLQALPAHHLHSVGNFSFYDPVSKLLFSGDIGANFPPGDLDEPVTKLRKALPYMEDFHRRYMASNRACRFWVQMVRTLEIEAIVPHHGQALVGRRVVVEFLKWFEQLECGVDRLSQDAYRVPRNDGHVGARMTVGDVSTSS